MAWKKKGATSEFDNPVNVPVMSPSKAVPSLSAGPVPLGANIGKKPGKARSKKQKLAIVLRGKKAKGF